MRARAPEEDDVNDGTGLLHAVDQLVALLRQVLNDETRDHEREQRVVVEITENLRCAEPEGHEDDEKLPPDEAKVYRQDEPEGRSNRNAP